MKPFANGLRLLVHTNMKNDKSYFCNCLFFSSASFARNMSKLAEEAFAKTGWSSSHAFVMITVNRSDEGVTPTEIARELHLTPSTVTRLIDKLVQKEMVKRQFEGKHSLVSATEKSKAINDELMAAWNTLYGRYQDLLGKAFSDGLAEQLYDASEKIKNQ